MTKIAPAAMAAMIKEHFPDMVDVVLIKQRDFDELIADIPEELVEIQRTDPNFDISPFVRRLEIHLTEELEPETGVYAYMSPNTHRVFVYVQDA